MPKRKHPIPAPKAAAKSTPRGYPPARDDDGTFIPGNTGGRGGARPGAGRKRSEVKELWEARLDRLDDLAEARLVEILSGETKPNTLPDGTPVEGEFVLVVPPQVVMEAIKHVQNHKHGKPTVRVQVDAGDDGLLDTIDRAQAARVVELGKAHQQTAKNAKNRNRST
jgi:hypothetical protein